MPPRHARVERTNLRAWLVGLLFIALLTLAASACSDMGLHGPGPDPPTINEPDREPPGEEPPADEPPPSTGGIRGEVHGPVLVDVAPAAPHVTLVPHPHPVPASIVAGAVMVEMREPVPPAHELRRVLAPQGRTPTHIRASGMARTYELRFDQVDDASTHALAKALRSRPEVSRAETVPVVWPLAYPNDEYYALQWALTAIRAPEAWAFVGAADGELAPAVVAIIDTGSQDHPDLLNLPGWDFVDGDDDPRDPGPSDDGIGSHGVHVAGTAVARTNNTIGVAGVHPNGRVVPLRVIGRDGSGSLADVANAITWAAGGTVPGLPANAHPAPVINLSLGGAAASCPSFLQSAIDDAHARGSVVVAAAGNGGQDASGTTPANCARVITVGAVGPGGVRTPYSNYGAHVDVMAPGGDFALSGRAVDEGVLSTSWDYQRDQPDYVLMEGTSMAAPHVSGALALLRGHHPGLGPDAAVERLLAAARPMSAQECTRPAASDCGEGALDAYAALLEMDDPGDEPGDPGDPDPGDPDPGDPDPSDPVITYVIADRCLTSTCSIIDQAGSRMTALADGRATGPYAFDGLPNGTYEVWAFRDLDGNGAWDGDEPWAEHPHLVQIEGALVTGIDVEMPPTRLTGVARTLASSSRR